MLGSPDQIDGRVFDDQQAKVEAPSIAPSRMNIGILLKVISILSE
jgi:hypothetical protein